MIEVFSAESTLKAATSHTEGHGIHVDVSWFRLCLIDFFLFGIFIVIQGYQYFNIGLSSHPDMLGKSDKTDVSGDMAVINVLALSDLVNKFCFILFVSHTHEGDTWNSQWNARF